MYLHLGQDTTVLTEDLIGIFDLDTCTISAKTREFLATAEKEGRVVNTSEDLPKSFVVGRGENPEVIICQNSPATIKKRWAEWEENTRKNHKKMV